MKIYLAGSLSLAESLNALALRIEKETHHEIVSRWHRDLPSFQSRGPAVCGRMDLEDVTACNMLAAFLTAPSTHGGVHTEIGIALGWNASITTPFAGKSIRIVGDRLNVFHHLPGIGLHPDTESLMAELHRLDITRNETENL